MNAQPHPADLRKPWQGRRHPFVVLPTGRWLSIALPNGRTIAATEYARSWRTLKTLPAGRMIARWDRFPMRADTILDRIVRGMHDRINQHIPGYGQGRKWSQDWHWAAWRTARDVNTPRLIVRPGTVPFEFRARLHNRITHSWEE